MSSFPIPDEIAGKVQNIKCRQGEDAIVDLARISKELLPEFDHFPTDARTAVSEGKGNCVAHTRVVAELSTLNPRFMPMIDLRYYRRFGKIHAECLVLDLATNESGLIDNAGPDYYVNHTDDDEPARMAVSQASKHRPLRPVYGLRAKLPEGKNGYWLAEFLESINQKPSVDDPNGIFDRIIVEAESGLLVVDAVLRARSAYREEISADTRANDLERFLPFLPGFSILPIEKEKVDEVN